jgi:hypothetical protein
MRPFTPLTIVGALLAGTLLATASAAPAVAAPPPPPSFVGVDEITPHTIDVFWAASPGAVSYQVFVNGTRWTNLDPGYAPSLTLATLRHLPFNAAVVIEVRAVNAAGEVSAPSAPVFERTAFYFDHIAPKPPTKVHVSAEPFGPTVAGCPRFLRWTAGIDNYNDTMGESEVYRDGTLVRVVRRGGNDLGGLWAYIAADPRGTHVYTVKTLDQGGNTSAASAPLTVTITGC